MSPCNCCLNTFVSVDFNAPRDVYFNVLRDVDFNVFRGVDFNVPRDVDFNACGCARGLHEHRKSQH